ncbi:hypothetical protein GPJ56_006851 [Histomonas meleagridis]|uniref:uncharacterized protein n=1 Tax=Histomonas meleagridis TaxID=135588 RepID=UPI00355937D6|nr:hypothetical protein GPJ56_006851 [Histomonas meleagridis]KAH0802341.1 hypothetical protein GO595_004954 [Histomonas meleagridis]
MLSLFLRSAISGRCSALYDYDTTFITGGSFTQSFAFVSPIAYYQYEQFHPINLPVTFIHDHFWAYNVETGKDGFDIQHEHPIYSAVYHNDDGLVSALNALCPMYGGENATEGCCNKMFSLNYTQMIEVFPDSYKGVDKTTIYNTTRDASVDFTGLISEIRSYKFKHYPRCYNLIRYLPCAICHANISEMAFPVKIDGSDIIRSFPLCRSYALKIYRECRSAYYSEITGKIYPIVPKGMGVEEFMKVVHAPSEEDEIPNGNCIPEGLFSSSSIRFLPKKLLLIIAAVLTAILL